MPGTRVQITIVPQAVVDEIVTREICADAADASPVESLDSAVLAGELAMISTPWAPDQSAVQMRYSLLSG